MILASAAVATLLGCREAPTAPIAVALELDRDTYVAGALDAQGRYAFTVIVHYVNRTDGPIYFARCAVDSLTPSHSVPTAGGVSRSGYDAASACSAFPALELRPGDARTDSLLLQGPNAYDGLTGQPLGVLEGDFLLEYQTRRCAADTPVCWSAGPRVASAVFHVRLP